MAHAALLIGSLAFSALSTASKNRALERKQEAANDSVRRRIKEFEREQGEDDLVAQEKKSDRAKIADRQMGMAIAASADSGVTINGLARTAGNIGGIFGLDKARIEDNRQKRQSQRRAAGISTIGDNLAQQQNTQDNIEANTMQFFADAFKTGVAAYSAMGPTDDSLVPGGDFDAGSSSSFSFTGDGPEGWWDA